MLQPGDDRLPAAEGDQRKRYTEEYEVQKLSVSHDRAQFLACRKAAAMLTGMATATTGMSGQCSGPTVTKTERAMAMETVSLRSRLAVFMPIASVEAMPTQAKPRSTAWVSA